MLFLVAKSAKLQVATCFSFPVKKMMKSFFYIVDSLKGCGRHMILLHILTIP